MLLTATALIALLAGGASAMPAVTDPPPAASAVEPVAMTKGYARVVEAADGTLTLEIAAKTFAPKAGVRGPRVHLVGAVHIADKPFYTALQALLDASDLVLFEGVRPPGAGAFDAELDEAGKVKATNARLKFVLGVVEDDRSRTGKLPESLQQAVDQAGKRWKTMVAGSLTDAWGRPLTYRVLDVPVEAGDDQGSEPGQKPVVVSLGPDGLDNGGKGDDLRVEGKPAAKKASMKDPGLQAKMADALGLTFQLDQVDSSKPNWRSSDMSVDELQARFEKAGMEGSSLFKMLDGSSLMGQLASMLLGIVKSSPQLAASLKLTMVDLLGSPGAVEMGPPGMKKMMEVILKDRNNVVLRDLRAVIEKEDRGDVAIFYGAGHLEDMESKLRADLGYEPAGEAWLAAISVNPKAAGLSPEQARRMRENFKKQLARREEADRAKPKPPKKGAPKGDAQPQPAGEPEKP